MVVGVPFFSLIAGTMNLNRSVLSAIILAGGKSWHMGRRNSYATQQRRVCDAINSYKEQSS
jgi:hypothetical protein